MHMPSLLGTGAEPDTVELPAIQGAEHINPQPRAA